MGLVKVMRSGEGDGVGEGDGIGEGDGVGGVCGCQLTMTTPAAATHQTGSIRCVWLSPMPGHAKFN